MGGSLDLATLACHCPIVAINESSMHLGTAMPLAWLLSLIATIGQMAG